MESTIVVLPPAVAPINLQQWTLPRHHSTILWGFEILAAIGYELGISLLSYITLILPVLATTFVYSSIGSVPDGSAWKVVGAVATTGAIMFGITALGTFVLDFFRGKNHAKNIFSNKALLHTKVIENIDYSIITEAVKRVISILVISNILGDVFGKYVFSLSTAEFTAFSLIMAKTPWVTLLAGGVIAVPAVIIQSKRESAHGRQVRGVRGFLEDAFSSLVPVRSLGSTDPVPPVPPLVSPPTLPLSPSLATIHASFCAIDNSQTRVVEELVSIAHQASHSASPIFQGP